MRNYYQQAPTALRRFLGAIIFTSEPLRLVLLCLAVWWTINIIARASDVWVSPAMAFVLNHVPYAIVTGVWLAVDLMLVVGIASNFAGTYTIAYTVSAAAWFWMGLVLRASPYEIITQICWLSTVLSVWASVRVTYMRTVLYTAPHLRSNVTGATSPGERGRSR